MPSRLQLISNALGALVANWLSSLFSFEFGLVVLSIWGFLLAYQIATSEAFIKWAWRERRSPKMLTYGVAAFVGACAAMGLVRISELKHGGESVQSPAQIKLEDKISVHERNGHLWGLDDRPIQLTPDVVLHRIEGETAFFTPIVGHQNQDEVIAAGAVIWITINSSGAKLDFGGPYKLWRPVWSETNKGQQFVADIPKAIIPGKSGWGPNEMIQVKFPPGRYKIEYGVEGQSEKHQPFRAEGYYWVEVALKPKAKQTGEKEKRKVLWDLREEGVLLRNEIIRPDQYAEWHVRFEAWHARLIQEAGALDTELAAWLKTLDKVRPWDFGMWASPTHKKEQAILTEKLDRLEQYLKRNLV